MYSVLIVERLMREQRKTGSDLADFCFGDRRHTVRHLVKEGANPTAELIEKVADFLGVSIDELFGRYSPKTDDDRSVELMERLIRSQQAQLELQQEENALLKDKIRLLEFELREASNSHR